jgi:hypothetical protein
MKALTAAALLLFIIGNTGALDTTSYQLINHLVNLPGAGAPELFEGAVLFTAPASYKRVGVAFAHEGFSKVYWFQKLMVPDDSPNQQPEGVKAGPPMTYKDSGILFYVYTPSHEMRELEYRLVINGLWTADPANVSRRIDDSGIIRSVVSLPPPQTPLTPVDTPAGSLSFRYQAPSRESIYVAGSFNNWDPFMYELQEQTPGNYVLTLFLPPGVYQYAFFYRGERILDPNNRDRVYRDGRPVSQATVK